MLSWLAKTDGQDGKFIENNRHPSGGNCFVLTTPSGRKLAGGNGTHGAEAALQQGLKLWEQLSVADRKALPAGTPQILPEASRTSPPSGSLVVATFVRNLKRDGNGRLTRITLDDLEDAERYPGWNRVYTEPARFNLWLTEAEWRSLIPVSPAKGQSFAVPDPIRWRILRYHLVDGTYGLPAHWKPEHIRAAEMTLTVEDVAPRVRMRLRGAALMRTGDDDQSGHGYEAALCGILEYDPASATFTRFDLTAVGECWGGDWEGGRFKRPGRAPLGVAFGLSGSNTAADRVPPLVHMDRQQVYEAYFHAEP